MSDSTPRDEREFDVLSTISGSKEGAQGMKSYFESLGALGSHILHTGIGEIWARDAISRRDRSLIVISALTALGRERELQAHIGAGLNHGLTRDEIDEIMVQLCAYVGAPFALGGAGVAAQVFAQRDGTETRETAPPPAELKDEEKRRLDGKDVVRTIVGDPNLDPEFAASATLDSLGPVVGKLVLDYAFGDVWARPQLSRRDRSMVVISGLTACNLKHELEIHIGAGLNHGITRDEVVEIMVTNVLYGGFPRAIDGMILATKVFAERDAAGKS